MKLLALDCSTKSTGVAIYNNNDLIYYECITASSTDLVKRIYKMKDRIKEIIDEYRIESIVMEEVLPEFGSDVKNIKTYKALMYLQAELNFLIHDTFPSLKIEFMYPSEWRKICGISQGRGIDRGSLKPRDIAFVKDKFNLDVNDDIADAIGIGYAYIHRDIPIPSTKKKIYNWS